MFYFQTPLRNTYCSAQTRIYQLNAVVLALHSINMDLDLSKDLQGCLENHRCILSALREVQASVATAGAFAQTVQQPLIYLLNYVSYCTILLRSKWKNKDCIALLATGSGV